LRPEEILRHPASESSAQPFAFWSLHQNDKHHQDGDDDVESEQNIDQQGHWDGQYRKPRQFVK